MQQLKLWAEQARMRGIATSFVAQLRSVIERLSTGPLGWGERRGTLRGRNLAVRHGAVSLFHVQFAVDSEARVVFVMEIRPMPNSPLTK
jgi:hypothetical protein